MTIKKKPTNLNRRRRPIGKIYRSFEDDVWGRFVYKNINFKQRYRFLFKSSLQKKRYKNMIRMWNLIKKRQFPSCIKKNKKDKEKNNILRLDIINPRKKTKRFNHKNMAAINAKKFRGFYQDIKVFQLKRIIHEYKKENLNKYKIFLLALESRLDVMIYRLHFVDSIGQARQLISHGNIIVNGKIVNQKNYQLKALDIVSSVIEKRNFFLRNILQRLLPFKFKEILYYYPVYYEVNFRILSATFLGYNIKFTENNIPFFSSLKPADGFVYHTYKSK